MTFWTQPCNGGVLPRDFSSNSFFLAWCDSNPSVVALHTLSAKPIHPPWDSWSSRSASPTARPAGMNKFGERVPGWRDVWTIVKMKAPDYWNGRFWSELQNAVHLKELSVHVLEQRCAKIHRRSAEDTWKRLAASLSHFQSCWLHVGCGRRAT